jgi:hypothetical protein
MFKALPFMTCNQWPWNILKKQPFFPTSANSPAYMLLSIDEKPKANMLRKNTSS